jgi:hypothetical protein
MTYGGFHLPSANQRRSYCDPVKRVSRLKHPPLDAGRPPAEGGASYISTRKKFPAENFRRRTTGIMSNRCSSCAVEMR